MHDSLLHAGSVWSATQIEQFLLEADIPVRLACLSGRGAPLLCSLWFLYEDDAIWCATQRDAALVSWLQRDARCAFEIAGDRAPYRGVRGQGSATVSAADGPRVLQRLIDRYLQGQQTSFSRWLLARQDEEVAIRIEPSWVTSWDYSARMGR